MKFAITCGFLIFIAITQAQNLVVNPGFEEFRKGTGLTGNVFATYGINGWSQPTAGSADWYCNIEGDGNPLPPSMRSSYFGGKISPHSGHSFSGLHHTIDMSGTIQCEYATGSLTTSLQAGHTYILSLWIALAKTSDIAVSRVQVSFNSIKSHYSTLEKLSDSATVSFHVDTNQVWTRVQAEFVAQGGEQYFTIGNFSDKFADTIVKISNRRGVLFSYSYYYIDDFSLTDKNSADPITITPGQKLIFNNILFETGNSTLTTSSYAQLDQIVAAMKKQSKLKVEISGHTDSDGSPASNQTLSEQRALAVKQYFISKGIDSTRITTVRYGSSKPISPDKSKNRRVEFYFSE